MDFTLSPEIEDLRLRVRAFVEEHVLPLEADPKNFSEHENIPEDRLAKVREKAKKAGLWAPQSPREFGGMDLPIVAWAAIYEEAARSIFGPLAFNCMAPDDGNMNVLKLVGTREQKEKWLKPIVEGKVRSTFTMTEPAPGGGSDPSMIRTRAEKKGDRYIIKGHKWFATGAQGAAHFILVARTSDDKRRGLTAFLFHKDQPGWRILRRIPIMGPHEHGGHCELEFDGLEIPAENPDRPAAHNARGLDARSGRTRAQGSIDGQSAGCRHAAQGCRRGDPAAGRARLLAGFNRAMDLSLCALGPPGGWRLRGAHDGACALHEGRGAGLLEMGPGRGRTQRTVNLRGLYDRSD